MLVPLEVLLRTWPVLLQGKLSDRDVVTVHGRGGLTLANTSLDRIDATWVGHTQQHARALQLDAHIVVIYLGTNDCRWSAICLSKHYMRNQNVQ